MTPTPKNSNYKSVCCGDKVNWLDLDEGSGTCQCSKCGMPCKLTLTKAGIEASVASSHSLSYPETKNSNLVKEGDWHNELVKQFPNLMADDYEDALPNMKIFIQSEKQKSKEEGKREMVEEIIKYTKKQHKLPENRDVSFGFGYQLCLQELKNKLQMLKKNEM